MERHYQQRAIRRIAETFERDQHRKALVVMATGAGKTRTVIALVDLLMRAGWAKRVLFGRPRGAGEPGRQRLQGPLARCGPGEPGDRPRHRGAGVCIDLPHDDGAHQRKANAGGGQRRFGVGHFDLIVVDEAHRSIYQKYRAIFSYFDACWWA